MTQDYLRKNYRSLSRLQRLVLRFELWYWGFEVRNTQRLIVRIKDEVLRNIAENDELYFYQRDLLRQECRAHELRQALELDKEGSK